MLSRRWRVAPTGRPISRAGPQRPAVRILGKARPAVEARRRGSTSTRPLRGPWSLPVIVSVHDLSFYRYPSLPAHEPSLPAALLPVEHLGARLVPPPRAPGATLDIPGAPRAGRPGPLGVDGTLQPVTIGALAAFAGRGACRAPSCLGTLEPRKNLPTLLAAYAHLAGRPGFRHTLVIAGGRGWYYDAIDAVVERLGLGGRVLFPGYVPDGDLPLWYSAADLFVYPSLYEGYGLPPLEALACGTPVVTSDASSLPEVVGDAGLTVPAEDDLALAEAMARLLADDALRADLRARGLARARTQSWQRVARETARAYHRVLGEQ